jgi:hypothetical protein
MSDRRVVLKTAFALSLLTVAAWACVKSPESQGAMLMDRMRQLAQSSALTFELVQETLEVAFVRDEAASHEMVAFFVGTPRPGSRFEGLIKLVDCRVPTPQNTALKEPFVLVELQGATGEKAANREQETTATPLLAKDVVAKLGQPYSFDPALPEDSESWGSYVYRLGSRSLWVNLGRQAPDKVRSFSIHPLEDVRKP